MSTAQFDKWFGYDGTLERIPCLAMAKFDHAGNMPLAVNIASITKLMTGHWRVVFSKPMPSIHYAVSIHVSPSMSQNQLCDGIMLYNADSTVSIEAPTVNGFTFGVINVNAQAWVDPSTMNLTVHARLP